MRAGLPASLFALGLALQQVVATDWKDYDSFSCPSNTKNDCDDKEQKGFDWGDLNVGSVDKYNGYSFSGFECKNSFGKRDALSKRTFNSKCIQGSVKDSGNSNPKFSCDSGKKFSIDQFDVSVDVDIDLEFHYQMDDGSTCKHVSPCQASGSSVKNTQCGGAKAVTVQIPEKDKGKGKSCNVGIHSIKFNCNTQVSSKPGTSKTTSSYSSSKTGSATTTATTTSSSYTKSTTSYGNGTTTSSTYSKPSSSSSSSSSSSTPGASPLVPGSGCPELVPRCLSTWIFSTGCKDNADYDCFCKLDTFVINVVSCVQAWGSQIELENAVSFFAGICANYIPQNPAIITAMPCPLTAGYSPPSSIATVSYTAVSAAPAPPKSVPLTTITASVPCTTKTVTASTTAASAAPTGTMQYCPTVIIVPQVALVQQPGPGSSIILSQGTTTNVPAYTTAKPVATSSTPATGGVKPTASPSAFTGAAASTSPFPAAALAVFVGGLLMLVVF
ncbi:hypothetical protein GP486_007820 [Trichoglossum hirsutum]|uniref:CFEM domain-containing protein n=1 Tax=Trichoglossum hirsutum TaxID=265104 RepID=A0A9P8IB09_9PEZI|nr:hypothetical protein GP486_007820 [Trichoglossum hirsutum]